MLFLRNAFFAKQPLQFNKLSMLTPKLNSLQQQSFRFAGRHSKKQGQRQKTQKGRVTLRSGGSIRGSTLTFGDYGLRLKSQGLRLIDKHFKELDRMILRDRRKLGVISKLRLKTNVPVFHKGNHIRMGKGKGAFVYWMVRVPTGKVLIEVKGCHELVAKQVLNKINKIMPGDWEIIKRGEYLPRISTTEVLTKQIPGQKVPEGLPESFKLKPEEIDVRSIVNNKTWRKYECRMLAKSSYYSKLTGRYRKSKEETIVR
ncbi:hypothetical protein QEN19_003759 [Hanseniaspora menglaensis]